MRPRLRYLMVRIRSNVARAFVGVHLISEVSVYDEQLGYLLTLRVWLLWYFSLVPTSVIVSELVCDNLPRPEKNFTGLTISQILPLPQTSFNGRKAMMMRKTMNWRCIGHGRQLH